MSAKKALFAAGCFWGVQYYFDHIPGVVKTTVGYAGGTVPHPSYDAVTTGKTGHAEAVLIGYDPKQVSYPTLVCHFFRLHDPTQRNRQGPDIGTQYRSIIIFQDHEQQLQAIQVRNAIQEAIGKPVVTEIITGRPFYEAEGYHQKYTERTGIGMCHVPYAPLP